MGINLRLDRIFNAKLLITLQAIGIRIPFPRRIKIKIEESQLLNETKEKKLSKPISHGFYLVVACF
jgi:hypothetical protein